MYRRPILLSLALLPIPALPPARAQTSRVAEALAAMERAAGGRLEAAVIGQGGVVGFLTTANATPIPVAASSSAPAGQRARDFLRAYGAAFGAGDGSDLVLLRSSIRDPQGMEHVRFRQTLGGVPVTGGELAVHLRGNTVVAVNARTLPSNLAIDLVPTIPPEEARSGVDSFLLNRLDVQGANLGQPELQVFHRGLLEGGESPTRLAWFIEATATELREYFWVDAHSGAVLLHFSQLPTALNRLIYDATSGSSLPGSLVRSEGAGPTGDPDIDSAYDYSGDTYDYFFDQHGRDSYDGAGAALISTIDYCPSPAPADCPYFNAFWNGSQMVYGDGFPAADDVDAHELTHAVTEHSANLFYYMQSGALNESFSDIFGETVDLLNGSGSDTPIDRWRIGEDVPVLGAIRDMMDPTIFGDPGKLSDSQVVCATPGTDQGGVHSNSGVPNHAYALMVDGGSYNGQTVSGIGLTKAGTIQYRTLTEYLLSASDFLDAYHALRQSCRDLVGSAGITAADCAEVDRALIAVEMDDPWPCAPPQPTGFEPCPFGNPTSTLFSDDLESGGGNWLVSAPVGSPIWFLGNDFASSGTQHLYGDDPAATTDSSVYMNSDVAIPAGSQARLQFAHSYGFEDDVTPTYYDGGVIEYSVDGGTTWLDAGALISRGAAYAGTLSTCCGNPLGGGAAFVGDSFGYTATQLDLSSLAGQSVRFGFRIGADAAVGDYGWLIDDVSLYTCTGETSLWDQTDLVSVNGLTSQEFEPAEASFDSMAADDFTVPPATTWKIEGLQIPGFYPSGDGPMPLLNIELRADSGGLPGSVVCSYPGLRSGIEFADSAGDLTVSLPAPCCLGSGTHWLMAQADMDVASGGQWFWSRRTVQAGAMSAWQNPANGFLTGCTSWSATASCVAPDPDLLFALWQVAPAVSDLELSGETVDGTRLYEASSTIAASDFHVAAPADVTLRAGTRVSFGDGFSVESGSTLRVSVAAPTGCP